jgi:hypothetical protein
VRGRRPEPLDEGSIYCFVSIKLSFVEAGLTRRILRLALRANSLRSFVQNRSCDFVEPGYRVRGRRPEPLDEGSIYCFVSIKLSFVEAGLTRRILRLALFVEPGCRVRGRRPEPLDEGSKGLILCPGFAGAAIIRSLSLFPSGICIE